MTDNEKKSASKEDLLEKIVDSLEKNNLPDNSQFYAEENLLIEDIEIKIDEIGELSFPLSDNCIEKLINISSKAQFGSGERTLLDENVRNTHEITSDKLHVCLNEKVLNRMMNKLRNELGLDDKCALIPHLHNMLIYRVGQFFDMHQDGEKLKNMVGTLVIVLPNAHIGGDLVIEYGERKHIFSSEAIKPIHCKCIAFYADCNHKVEKVKDGHRIAVTYNLVLQTDDLVLPSLIVNERLCEAVKNYFDLKEHDQKLVYFFNHSYTEHGLKWNLLKGEDRTNGRALHTAAQQLCLIPHLALVEIREHWSAIDYDDVDELIEDEITLSFWVDTDNNKVPFSSFDITKDDTCFTKETDSFEPSSKEYEGYTGNAGKTMDYWYRRAAIVLWPESIKIYMNFSLGFNYAYGKISELCKTPGNEKEVMEIVTQPGKYFRNDCNKNIYKFGTEVYDQDFNLKLAVIASYVENSESAYSLLLHLRWDALSPDFVEKLANLQLKYGVQWCMNLFNKIKANSVLCLEKCDLVVGSFLKYNLDTSLAKFLLGAQFENIKNEKNSRKATTYGYFNNRLLLRIQELREFFQACLICKDYSSISKMIESVVSNTQRYPLNSMADLYVELHENIRREERDHFKELKSYLTKTIDHKIASGVKREDDWSVNVQSPCSCVNCTKTTSFFHSKTQKTKVWPLSEKYRNHIINCFNNSRLPVKFSIERTGSPFKLVLIKTDELHKEILQLKLCQQKLRALND